MSSSADERSSLTAFLAAQRAVVLEIVDGLGEKALGQPLVPSGWTPLGMIGHLGYAERHWFERVVAGTPEPLGDPLGEEAHGGPFSTARPADVVFGFYRDQTKRSDEILAGADLDSAPRGTVQAGMTDTIATVRDVVLHMIEETARHAGHLDIARELIDGRTGLGAR
ncbi:MAG: DinB family protein [Propionibacteriales bacterium]|nr:DinB family protein [Propionibacteriales bacterium]